MLLQSRSGNEYGRVLHGDAEGDTRSGVWCMAGPSAYFAAGVGAVPTNWFTR